MITRNLFTLSARNWNNGTGELTYDNATYTVKCAACPNVAVTTLLVKKSEAHKIQKDAANSSWKTGY